MQAGGTLIVETVWWLSFWSAVGLAFGSFLNVVIYRIPREKSLREPRWSACPACNTRIHWYDNIPVWSYLRLGGRCRTCSVPISVRYVVIEVVMGIIVLALLDAFFVGAPHEGRSGLRVALVGLTDQLAYDWPVFLAHIILFGFLLALAAIDLEHYWVDIRFTNIATIAGFALHTIWTPRHSIHWSRPSDATAIVCLFALAGLVLTWIVLSCQPETADERDDPLIEPSDAEEEPSTAATVTRLPPSLRATKRTSGWVCAGVMSVLVILILLDVVTELPFRQTGRAILVCALLFVLIVSESAVSRESDGAILEAIEEERGQSRRMVLHELLLLSPALLLGLAGLWFVLSGGDRVDSVSKALHLTFHVRGVALLETWQPLQGLATAGAGYIIGGALGWVVRIGFTLLRGKEALGSGDIHMMAAAGAVAGWPVALLGFIVACGAALIGWTAALPFKRSNALPLGPWLALGFLVLVLFYQPIVNSPLVQRTVTVVEYLTQNNSQPRLPRLSP